MRRRSYRSRLDQWQALRASSLVLFSALFGGIAIDFGSALITMRNVGMKQASDQIGTTEVAQQVDLLALSRPLRADRLDRVLTQQSNQAAKKSVGTDRYRSTTSLFDADAKFAAEALLLAPSDEATQAENGNTADIQSDPSPTRRASHNLPAGITRDPKTGELSIGSFEVMSFSGEPSSCREIGESIVDDFTTFPDALQVIAENDLITVARICASNGSVILSCRNGGVTISPRRSRPDDGCSGEKA